MKFEAFVSNTIDRTINMRPRTRKLINTACYAATAAVVVYTSKDVVATTINTIRTAE